MSWLKTKLLSLSDYNTALLRNKYFFLSLHVFRVTILLMYKNCKLLILITSPFLTCPSLIMACQERSTESSMAFAMLSQLLQQQLQQLPLPPPQHQHLEQLHQHFPRETIQVLCFKSMSSLLSLFQL